MTRPKILTPDAAGRELAKVLRFVARREEALKELVKERRGEIAALLKRARELESIALGEAQQVELDTGEDLPGDGISDGGRDARKAAEALTAARSPRRERQKAQEAERAAVVQGARDALGLDTITPEHPIAWRTEADGRVLGCAVDGVVYMVARRDSPGGGQYRWTRGHKARGPWVPFEADAKRDAERAERERIEQGALDLPEKKGDPRP